MRLTKGERVPSEDVRHRASQVSRFPILPLRLRFGAMAESLVVNEIYLSLQGESTFAGLPCVFVRLTACNLRCSYCDTAYAFAEGKKLTLEKVRADVRRLATPFTVHASRITHHVVPLVELTGGEPLL